MPRKMSKSMRNKRRQRGGATNTGFDTTGAWGNAVFGNPQHAVNPIAGNTDNTVHMNNVPTCTGGGVLTPEQAVMGGNMLGTVAVPAVLLAANQYYGKKKAYSKKNFSKRKFRRFRGTRRVRK
jgi:hypothetical protein